MKKNGQFVGVDEKYIPEEEKYVDDNANNEIKDLVNDGIHSVKNYVTDKDNQEKMKKTGKKGLKILKGVGIGYLAFWIFILVVFIVVFAFALTTIFKASKGFDKSGIPNSEISSATFNGDLEIYTGTNYGLQISNLLDNAVTKIKKNSDHPISVTYGDTTTSNPEEISALKKKFEDWTKYEVSLDYDDNQYVYKITITDYE